jgi:hypothetical protein
MRKVVSFDTRSLWRYFDLQLCWYIVHRKVESKISCIKVNFNYILYIYIYTNPVEGRTTICQLNL